jgi:hypothetical protein
LNFARVLLGFPFGSQIGVTRNFPTSSLIVPFTSWKLPLIWSFVLVFMFPRHPRKARIGGSSKPF